MPITAFTTIPSRSRPSTFESDADAFFSQLSTTFVNEANALEQSLQASAVTATSTSSLTVATGAQSITTQTGKSWVAGSWLYVINSAAPATYMVGQVTSYNSGTGALVLNVTTTAGTGTISTWAIAPATPPGAVSGLSGGTAGVVPYQSATGVTGFTAAGTSGQLLASGGTGAPTWTSSPAVTTQAVSNNSTAAASTAFVRSLGTAKSSVVSRTANATLTSTDIGTLQVWSGTTAGTLTLPAASAVPAGLGIEFVGSGTTMAACTISRAGADTIIDGDGSFTSTAITQPGSSCQLVSDGVSTWRYIGTRRRYESAWTSPLPALNTATSFTHGLGVTPRNAWMLAECTTVDGTYAVGDRVMPWTNNAAYGAPSQFVMTGSALILVTQATGGWAAVPKTGGNPSVTLTSTNWRYKVIAEV